VSHEPEIPEHLREYFGHDKVAFFGSGGLPAAPPAPPGSPARRQGEAALADALSKVGSREPRPGTKPAATPPRPAFPRLMRSGSERALMEISMRRLGRRTGAQPPHVESPWLFRAVVAPVYRLIPWGLKKRIVTMTSGVKGWRTSR
jgi:hypothetical protein